MVLLPTNIFDTLDLKRRGGKTNDDHAGPSLQLSGTLNYQQIRYTRSEKEGRGDKTNDDQIDPSLQVSGTVTYQQIRYTRSEGTGVKTNDE